MEKNMVSLVFLTAVLFWYIGYQFCKLANGIEIKVSILDLPFAAIAVFFVLSLMNKSAID